MQEALKAMVDLLDEQRPAPASLSTNFDTSADLAALIYPVKQMLKASSMIRQELAGLVDEPTAS